MDFGCFSFLLELTERFKMKGSSVLVLIFIIQNVLLANTRANEDKNLRHGFKPQHSDENSNFRPELEADTLSCPLGCVCQYAHFTDLPISRWINRMQAKLRNNIVMPSSSRTANIGSVESEEDLANDIEAMYEHVESFLVNPFVKQATCILQADYDVEKLVSHLPLDLKALVLLYTDVLRNKTVNLSVLSPLNQLTTLEIRGGQNRSFRLVFDEPLSFLQHANFESITLLRSENYQQPKNPVHPSDSFDYKPRGEFSDSIKLDFEQQQLQAEILPYDEYRREMRKARMPSFYGWERLRVLRIHACELNELHWEMFDGLVALQHLSLEHNAIAEVPPFSLFGALHIKTLSLAHNRIHDLHYRGLAGLLELVVLDLSDNHLTKLSERSFPPFPRLQSVDFRNNPIMYILPASFWVMNSTRVMLFDSREQPLELWPTLPFGSLRELLELSVGNASVGTLEQNVFKGLVALEKLTLRGEMRSIEFDAFAGLGALLELDLSHCSIHDISMDALMGCRKLKVLNLAHNNLSYLPPGLFEDQTQLEEVYLQGNQLRTLAQGFFLQPKLRLARLSGNPWKCSCDMRNWRAKITNQERGPRAERCLTDFHTGKKLSCRSVDIYRFDHRNAPRCANFNERSVFYVLRKQLQCASGRILRRVKSQRNATNWRHSIQQQSGRTTEMKSGDRMAWQLQREEKIRRTKVQNNRLDYVLQEQKSERIQSPIKVGRHASNDDNNVFSNDV